ncbi:hypothetical protein [Brevundimonas sp.]|jgi:hypothetical protein|uniref:hypothetical protein n=1 Tax=Brevundimonas sp. TaxID=1871086 RepID=UPI0037842F41
MYNTEENKKIVKQLLEMEKKYAKGSIKNGLMAESLINGNLTKGLKIKGIPGPNKMTGGAQFMSGGESIFAGARMGGKTYDKKPMNLMERQAPVEDDDLMFAREKYERKIGGRKYVSRPFSELPLQSQLVGAEAYTGAGNCCSDSEDYGCGKASGRSAGGIASGKASGRSAGGIASGKASGKSAGAKVKKTMSAGQQAYQARLKKLMKDHNITFKEAMMYGK